jgi:hypothetical protein
MQTFLPSTSFKISAQILDYKRLGKQRIEAKQLLNILLNRTDKKGWRHHPALLQWIGYEEALKHYYNEIVIEWINRGYKNTMKLEHTCNSFNMPHWLNDNFCSYHRQTLLFKNYEYYKQFGWKETPKYEYFWPIKNKTKGSELNE